MSRVSFIVPSYNAEAFVGRCLRSVLSQTCGDMEVIVVDDGSTDHTASIVEGMAALDSRLRLLRQPHRGVASARNLGLAEAHGTFIAFVDADDYLHPQYVELLLRALEEHPDADLAVTPSVRTNQSADASLGVSIRHAETVTGDGPMIRKALFAGGGGMSHNQWHTCHGKLFRRELLEGLSFPSGYTVYEDALFMNSVYARVRRYVMLRERIYFWVLHQQSALAMGSRSQGTNAYLECLRTIDREDSELRAACLSRIIMHDVWLKYLGEEHHSLPRAVWSEYIMSSSVSLFDKWKMLRLELCPKYRREFVESPRETEQHARPGVGKAPEDTNGLVSVIVPVCNVEAWLPSCLDSIINQSYSNLEIILVDDGSTDTSGYICEIYAARDNRIKVVHQKNQGLSGARNSGLAIATGAYVIMPDADDTLHPQLIEIAHRALQRGDFPFAMVWKQDTRHVISYDAMPEIEHGIQLRLLTQQELIGGLTNRTEMDVNCHVVWNKLYRRSAIGHLRFEDTASQDTVFNARLYLRIPYAIVVDAPLYYWLQRRGSLSRNPDTPKDINRLYSSQLCVDMAAGNKIYEAWFLQYLYQSIPRVRRQYKGHRLNGYARRVCRKVVFRTARSVVLSRYIKSREKFRLLWEALF